MNRYFTIGMAGHIDHGKTALTKALTGIQTDHLKEEKERNISIELGFAPFINEAELEVSIVDVPGHENFIRQMIAGVAGIDMVIVVIAANEGVMPQTKEHLDILSLLGIQNGFVVITKMDQTEQDLLEIVIDDVKATIQHTFLHHAPMFFVDSLSNQGIPELKDALKKELLQTEKTPTNTPFRLPIDQVFTLKGQGVVVRGTIYNGTVHQGDQLKVLPSNQEVRVRQIQRHHQQVIKAAEGQRTAINIGGISYGDISRGDVLVVNDYYAVTNRIDIVFYPLPSIQHKIKQRQFIKLHIGTTEVMGRIIFFDRNSINVNDDAEVLCQIELNNKIVVARNDHFIIRRPSPAETIGGGWVLDAHALKYRFGQQTIDTLQTKQAGSPTERIAELFRKEMVISSDDILKHAAVTASELEEAQQELLEVDANLFTLSAIFEQVKNRMMQIVKDFHQQFPMQPGMNKAEIISALGAQYPLLLLEYTIQILREDNEMTINEQYVALHSFTPSLPEEWKKKLEQAEQELINQGAEVSKWSELLEPYQIPSVIQNDFYYFLIQTNRAFIFDEDRLISAAATEHAVQKLVNQTKFADFTLQTARGILQLSRKNLVPLLELLDRLNYTKRVESVRTWIKNS